jgi:hypothetical protein
VTLRQLHPSLFPSLTATMWSRYHSSRIRVPTAVLEVQEIQALQLELAVHRQHYWWESSPDWWCGSGFSNYPTPLPTLSPPTKISPFFSPPIMLFFSFPLLLFDLFAKIRYQFTTQSNPPYFIILNVSYSFEPITEVEYYWIDWTVYFYPLFYKVLTSTGRGNVETNDITGTTTRQYILVRQCTLRRGPVSLRCSPAYQR